MIPEEMRRNTALTPEGGGLKGGSLHPTSPVWGFLGGKAPTKAQRGVRVKTEEGREGKNNYWRWRDGGKEGGRGDHGGK